MRLKENKQLKNKQQNSLRTHKNMRSTKLYK